MKITGILIPEDMDKPIEKIEFDRSDIKKMQGYVGGNFDVIDLDRPHCSIFFGDESKLTSDWQANRRATWLLWLHKSEFRRMDVIAGDAFITGPPDKGGNTKSVPGELLTLLFDTSRFKVEVQTEEGGEWSGNELEFAEWGEAYQYALRLADRWIGALHVRVIPA